MLTKKRPLFVREIFTVFTLVVTCVVLRKTKEGKLQALILRRADTEEMGPGLWTVPGGRFDDSDRGERHETPNGPIWKNILERAAAREVLEETGLCPDKFFPLRGSDLIFVRKNGIPSLCLNFWAACRYDAEVHLDRGATEYAWVGRSELTARSFIGKVAEDIDAAMREYVEHFYFLAP